MRAPLLSWRVQVRHAWSMSITLSNKKRLLRKPFWDSWHTDWANFASVMRKRLAKIRLEVFATAIGRVSLGPNHRSPSIYFRWWLFRKQKYQRHVKTLSCRAIIQQIFRACKQNINRNILGNLIGQKRDAIGPWGTHLSFIHNTFQSTFVNLFKAIVLQTHQTVFRHGPMFL